MLLLGTADVVLLALSALELVARIDILTRFSPPALVRLGDGVVLALAIATCHLNEKSSKKLNLNGQIKTLILSGFLSNLEFKESYT